MNDVAKICPFDDRMFLDPDQLMNHLQWDHGGLCEQCWMVPAAVMVWNSLYCGGCAKKYLVQGDEVVGPLRRQMGDWDLRAQGLPRGHGWRAVRTVKADPRYVG